MFQDKSPTKGRRGGSLSASGEPTALFNSPVKTLQPSSIAPQYGHDETKRTLFPSPGRESASVSPFSVVAGKKDSGMFTPPPLMRSKSELPASAFMQSGQNSEPSAGNSIFKGSSPTSGQPSPRFGGGSQAAGASLFSKANPPDAAGGSTSIFSSSRGGGGTGTGAPSFFSGTRSASTHPGAGGSGSLFSSTKATDPGASP